MLVSNVYTDELSLTDGSNSSQQSAAADSSKPTTTMTSVDKPTTDTVSDASSLVSRYYSMYYIKVLYCMTKILCDFHRK